MPTAGSPPRIIRSHDSKSKYSPVKLAEFTIRPALRTLELHVLIPAWERGTCSPFKTVAFPKWGAQPEGYRIFKIEQYRHPGTEPETNSRWGGVAPPVGLSPTPQGNLGSLPKDKDHTSRVRGERYVFPSGRTTFPPSVGCKNKLAGRRTDADIANGNRLHVPHTSQYLTAPAEADFLLFRWTPLRRAIWEACQGQVLHQPCTE